MTGVTVHFLQCLTAHASVDPFSLFYRVEIFRILISCQLGHLLVLTLNILVSHYGSVCFCLRYTALDKHFICLFLTCVAVEMCKVSKTGAGACIHVRRGSKDVSTQVTEEVKPLVMELLLMGLATAHHWRLVETRHGSERWKTAGNSMQRVYVCVSKSS